ncbi:hypothetical protein [Apibacter sp. HY039]|uniref:hypothetical protein n=1 Tax=Apibacter sp. HY039 TaxID=2501476 RepID=UPI000FEBF5DA|nr:hypothetical protein [Apibacter sp. HY039]
MNKQLTGVLCIGLLTTNNPLASQVGVNTQTPASTLDIVAKNVSGSSTGVDGLLVPRIDRLRAQSMSNPPVSTMVYINSVSTGTQTGLAANIDAVGYYYYNGTAWVKLYNPTNNNSLGQNIYNTDGSLSASRTVTLGSNTLAFAGGTTTNAFSVNGTTFSIDAANKRVGIGTASPANALHVTATSNPLRLTGVQKGDVTTNQLLTIDTSGNVKNIGTIADLSIPSPAILRLETTQNDFLSTATSGSKQTVPMSIIKNTIPGMTYDASTYTVTFPAGTYQIIFTYEAVHNSTNCTISSYFVDFPSESTTTRIHSTASHNQGNLSNHGGSIIYASQINANVTWMVQLGRGQSGNCSGTGMSLMQKSTQVLIFKIGN